MKKSDQTAIETHIVSLVLLEKLDELQDKTKNGLKFHCKKLIKEIEQNDRTLSDISSQASEVLSKGFSEMLSEIIDSINN